MLMAVTATRRMTKDADMPDRQAPYAAMLSRMAYQRPLPQSWKELLADVRDFVDPLVIDTGDRLTAWDPVAQIWGVNELRVSNEKRDMR